jgi:hypothetical protein
MLSVNYSRTSCLFSVLTTVENSCINGHKQEVSIVAKTEHRQEVSTVVKMDINKRFLL